jgi:ABC-type uncharacterized transport system substrate-binding protein
VKRYLIAIVLVLLAFSAQAKSWRVTVLLAEEGTSYSEFARSFAAEAERNNLSLSIDQTSSLPQETDLLVAVGTKSAAMALNSRFPVLVVLVSKAGFDKLQRQILDHLEHNIFSAIYLDQPSRRQIDLIAVALPNVKNVGLFVSAQSADMTSLRKAMTESRFVLHEQQLESDETLYRDLHSLLQKSEILFAIPDAQIYNSSTMRNILLETYRSGIPMIGFSPAYVRAGALCAVFSTPEQIAKQAVSQARQFAESGHLSAIQYPSEFEVMVNPQVARSLGIDIKDAATLVRQMNAATVAGGRK